MFRKCIFLMVASFGIQAADDDPRWVAVGSPNSVSCKISNYPSFPEGGVEVADQVLLVGATISNKYVKNNPVHKEDGISYLDGKTYSLVLSAEPLSSKVSNSDVVFGDVFFKVDDKFFSIENISTDVNYFFGRFGVDFGVVESKLTNDEDVEFGVTLTFNGSSKTINFMLESSNYKESIQFFEQCIQRISV